MADRFEVQWRLTVEDEAGTLEAALAPETTGEHARLTREGDTLVVAGEGGTGSCLHAMDDVLACLTGALKALEADPGADDG